MGIPNAKKCFILQWYEDKDPTYLICVLDISYEDNIRFAIMNAYNDIIKDIDIGYIPEAHEVLFKCNFRGINL